MSKAILTWFMVRKAVSVANSPTDQGNSKNVGMTLGSAEATENSAFSLDMRCMMSSNTGSRKVAKLRARGRSSSGRASRISRMERGSLPA